MFLELHGKSIEFQSRTKWSCNKNERNKMNISKKDYKYIKKNDLEDIFITKIIYQNEITYATVYKFTRKEFLNLRTQKGKTEKYKRVILEKFNDSKIEDIEKYLVA